MGRHQKKSLEYFPLDVHLDQKIQLIEAEFGLTGFAVVIKLFQKIYGDQGYYSEWTDEVALLFSRQLGFAGEGGKAISEIVDASVKRGIFDSTLYEEYSILTSKGIQVRYLEAVNRRVNVELEERYLLVKVDQIQKNVTLKGVNVDRNKKNDDKSTQSKVNKSKVNKSKLYYGEFVSMTEEEYKKLVDAYGEEPAKEMIEILDNYKGSTGKKYKNDYRTILSWVVKRYEEELNKKNGNGNKSKKNGKNFNLERDTDYSKLENDFLDDFLEEDNEE